MIDVSPLRTKQVGWLKVAINEILELNSYESFQHIRDFSDIDQLGIYIYIYICVCVCVHVCICVCIIYIPYHCFVHNLPQPIS